jgi:drug/metabolite transporter (DMT)-like permease
LRARLFLVASAVLFSTGGAAIKGTQLNAAQVACFRSLVAAAAILLLIPESRRWKRAYVPVAICHALTLALFVTSTKLTTAANAIFLQNTAPLFVLLLGPVLLKEHIRRTDILFILALAVGMALFFLAAEPVRVSAPRPVLGNVLAALSAVTWAGTIMGLRAIGRSAPGGGWEGMSVIVMGNLLAAGGAMAFALPVLRFTPQDAAAVLWLGIFQIGLSYVCLTRGVRSVPALETTSILLLEPVLNPLWAWLLQDERPAGLAIAGGAVIFSATLVKAWWDQRNPRLQR